MHAARRRALSSRSARAALIAVASAAVAVAPASAAHAAGKAKGKKATSVVATSGEVTAKVSYTRSSKSYNKYRDLRLTVEGPQGILSKVKLPKVKDSYTRPVITLSDVNADGVVDAIVDTFSGGAHCCSSSSVAVSVATGWTKPITQAWGNYGYELKELGGAPGPEFASLDDRFAYAFSSYAASFPAIRILRIVDGTFADVTREYPDAIRADLAEKQGLYDDIAADAETEDYPNDVAQSAGAALIAEHLLLGDVEAAKAVLAKLDADGFLGKAGKDGGVSGTAFKRNLAKNFIAWGYLTSAAQLGL
jgi:hypothetical protein